MLRTIKNPKGKVVGVQINGKNYFLSKDVCHALSLEEKGSLEMAKSLKKEAMEIKNNITRTSFIGESKNIRVDLFFDDLGRIESSKSKIEFKSELDKGLKEKAVELLNDFILAANRASFKREQFLTGKLSEVKKSLNDEVA